MCLFPHLEGQSGKNHRHLRNQRSTASDQGRDITTPPPPALRRSEACERQDGPACDSAKEAQRARGTHFCGRRGRTGALAAVALRPSPALRTERTQSAPPRQQTPAQRTAVRKQPAVPCTREPGGELCPSRGPGDRLPPRGAAASFPQSLGLVLDPRPLLPRLPDGDSSPRRSRWSLPDSLDLTAHRRLRQRLVQGPKKDPPSPICHPGPNTAGDRPPQELPCTTGKTKIRNRRKTMPTAPSPNLRTDC